MEKKIEKKKYLCLETTRNDGTIIEHLSKCPANPEMVMAALQFLTTDICINISISDCPIDFSYKEVDK